MSYVSTISHLSQVCQIVSPLKEPTFKLLVHQKVVPDPIIMPKYHNLIPCMSERGNSIENIC